jgi:hypothetical protein
VTEPATERLTISLRLQMVLIAAVITAAIWLASGTMAPYASTVDYPTVLEPCHYIVSVDHLHFAAVFRMLAGMDRSTWEQSVVLRRVLYPIVAYPFVKTLGFLEGGLVASVVVHIASILAFVVFVSRKAGEKPAIAIGWLLATYPGMTYWAGLPYSYAAIVPSCLIAMILLWRLWEAESLEAHVSPALFLGIIFLAYDLLPFYAPAAMLLLIARKRSLGRLVVSATLLVLPSAVVAAMFYAMDVPLINSNTASYVTILGSYLHPGSGWGAMLVQLPETFVVTFLYSNFIFLPLLFVAAMIFARNLKLPVLAGPEIAVLIAVGFVFIVNNAAPPYLGWQLRGSWIARLYQPVFIAFLLPIARLMGVLGSDRRWKACFVATLLLNASIAFGGILLNPLASVVYQRFYRHSKPDAMITNLERYGRRPLGVCSADHSFDGIINPGTPWNRPSYMFRYPLRDR